MFVSQSCRPPPFEVASSTQIRSFAIGLPYSEIPPPFVIAMLSKILFFETVPPEVTLQIPPPATLDVLPKILFPLIEPPNVSTAP